MRKLYLLVLLTFAYTAGAITPPDLSSVRVPTSTDLDIEGADKYQAKNNSNYLGRNSNNSESTALEKVYHPGNISKSVSKSSNSKQAQMENLESTAGEFVQKLEEDRFRKAKEHEGLYTKAKDNYTKAYTDAKKIDVDNLGNEQDPYVQNAFKCKDLKHCDKGDNDPHAVPVCNDTQVLHWTGKKWQCLNQFKNPSAASCTSNQWAKKINNGTACVDYIYLWDETGTGACQKNSRADIIYNCMRKKTPTDKGTVVGASNCKASKPVGTKACTYYGVWKAGGWSGCSKSCGGGTQTRSVTCSAIECTASKPATSQACNTQACTASWSAGPWGACKNNQKCWECGSFKDGRETCCRDNYEQTRSIYCQAGFTCTGAKPSTVQGCSKPDRHCGKRCEG